MKDDFNDTFNVKFPIMLLVTVSLIKVLLVFMFKKPFTLLSILIYNKNREILVCHKENI